MAHQFLLEIGLEEMPAHVVVPTMKQFKEKTEEYLQEQELSYETIEAFSTPRRFGVKIIGIAEKQADKEEVVKGPAKKIALDENGEWTKAAQGFVRGQGLTTEDIFWQEIKGVEYVHVRKFTAGKSAAEILAHLNEIVMNLHFPVTMRWGNHKWEYIRPVHWVLSLLDDEVLLMEVFDVVSNRISYGHRFLGGQVTIDTIDAYEETLASEFVIVSPQKREQLILEQINAYMEKNHWKVELDPDLLEEVNNLVEYPTVFIGHFDEKYLEVPEEVLVTSMKEHQRYFDIRSMEGALLPYFVGVRNGDTNHLDNVRRGNEKVLTARLEDAAFFYQEDLKLTIEQCVDKLKTVTFHEKVGTMYEKMQRVQMMAALIGKEVELTEQELADLKRASAIYKFDLVTNMVGEFPELQGVMGERYALLQGESPVVARAIREHYLPVSSEGELPSSKVGAVLAVADKLDTLFTFFAVGMAPTGSNDPYALRRQTYGIVRIIAEQGWKFPIRNVQAQIYEAINQDADLYGISLEDQDGLTLDFVKSRIKQWMSTKGVRHDVIEAVTTANQDDLNLMFQAAEILKGQLSKKDFRSVIEALTRTINLAEKGKELLVGDVDLTIDPTLFENESEQALYDAVESMEASFADRTLRENYEALENLRPYIEQYFEETMVMAQDETVRNNRLKQLTHIAKMAMSFASLDKILVK